MVFIYQFDLLGVGLNVEVNLYGRKAGGFQDSSS